MRVVRVAPDTVYVHADENSSLGITPDEAIALRDLLLREFPVAAAPAPQSNSDRAFNNGWDAGWAAATNGRRHRRERIATALFAGMLANRDTHATAVLAVSYADSLIAALDKEQP